MGFEGYDGDAISDQEWDQADEDRLAGNARPPEGWTEMRCGAWCEVGPDAVAHGKTCRRCREDEAADRADMKHSDGEV